MSNGSALEGDLGVGCRGGSPECESPFSGAGGRLGSMRFVNELNHCCTQAATFTWVMKLTALM